LLIAVGAAAFFGSHLVTERVLAVCVDCYYSVCGTHYAAQVRYSSNGIGGNIRTQDVALCDTSLDGVSHHVGMSQIGASKEWNQIGFIEGKTPVGSISSPTVYEEFERIYCDPAYYFGYRGLVSGYSERFWVYWGGSGGPCPSNPSKYAYIWFFKRTSWSNPAFDFTYDQAATGRYDAETEHHDLKYMEPNGTICYGTRSDCVADSGYALKYYTQSSNTWSFWTGVPTVYEGGGYFRTGLANYWAFKTTGAW
jgi:hypothetical protein